jgi:hypothetical protein
LPALRNAKHELFCHNILQGMTGRQAYQAVPGFSATRRSADSNANRLLKNPKILVFNTLALH